MDESIVTVINCEGARCMMEKRIKEIATIFAEEAKQIYGEKLSEVILYGSCARGDNASRAWIRRHANWRGIQIRKGNQALGVPINVENLFAYTDNPVNNAFIHLWKKDFNWTPWKWKAISTIWGKKEQNSAIQSKSGLKQA